MSTQERLSLALTFMIGLIVGAYLYTTGFATTFKLPEANDAGVYKGFVINGESFGDCQVEESCVSFQILENGSYRAIFDTDSQGQKDSVKKGRLPRQLRLDLQRNLTAPELAVISQPQATPECQYVGTNFSFKVSLDEVEYKINTCVSDIDYEGAAWASLTAALNYIASRQ